MNEITTQLFNTIEKKKTELIETKLKEKGFGHLLVDIEKKRFPRILKVIKGKWEYYFADDGSLEGAFIVAIGEDIVPFQYSLEEQKDNTFTIESTLIWTDKEEAIKDVNLLHKKRIGFAFDLFQYQNSKNNGK